MQNGFSMSDFELARKAYQKSKNERSEKVFKWFYDHNKGFLDAHLEYAKSLFFRSVNNKEEEELRKKLGRQIIDEILANKRTDSDLFHKALSIKARDLYEQKNYQDAYVICDKLLLTQNYQDAYFIIGCIEARLGDVYRAMDTFSNCNRYSDSITKEMANIAIGIHDFELAEKYVAKLKSLPRYNPIYVEEIYLEIQKGNYEKAYNLYTNFIKRLRYISPSYVNIGLFLEYKLGINDLTGIRRNYLMEQLYSYSELRTKRYIINSHNDEKTSLIRTDRVYIDDMFSFFQKCIKDDEPIASDIVDYYVIELGSGEGPLNIGYVHENVITNTVKVGTITGTKKIVYVKPIESLRYIREAAERENGTSRKRNYNV